MLRDRWAELMERDATMIEQAIGLAVIVVLLFLIGVGLFSF